MLNEVLKADIHNTLSDDNIPWYDLKDSNVLVTGATGLIGGALIRTLSTANKKYNLGVRVLAVGRNEEKAKSLIENYGVWFHKHDIRHGFNIEKDRIDYIFHCAAITKSSDMLSKPLSVITTEVDGTRNTLELACEKQCKGFVYLSSMEVYGRSELKEVSENDLGQLDLTNPRSSYPESKRFCEMLCSAYYKEYSLPVKIARLARTFGAGTPNDENDMRVANQFARKAIASEDIELHTYGNSVANCCYTADAISGLLTVLFKGENGQTYNVANPKASSTVKEMAEIVAVEVCGGKIKVVMNVPEDVLKRGYAPDVGYTLNADKLAALGWKPKYGLSDMFKRMIADWQGSNI